MLEHMECLDQVDRIILEGIRKLIEVMDDVWLCKWRPIDIDIAFFLVFSAAKIKLFGGVSRHSCPSVAIMSDAHNLTATNEEEAFYDFLDAPTERYHGKVH
jgi:hypothetical protein